MEAKIKHLEFIENVIERMARNSFMLKGWVDHYLRRCLSTCRY